MVENSRFFLKNLFLNIQCIKICSKKCIQSYFWNIHIYFFVIIVINNIKKQLKKKVCYKNHFCIGYKNPIQLFRILLIYFID